MPRYGDRTPERKAAEERLAKERCDEADFDKFAVGPSPEWGLPRITAVLVRAAHLAQRGRRLTAQQLFDLSGAPLTSGTESGNSLSKAMTLMEQVGIERAPVRELIERVMHEVPWSLDAWNVENVAHSGESAWIPWTAMPDALNATLDGMLANAAQPVEDARVDWCVCSPAIYRDPPAPGVVSLLLTEKASLASDALLAMFGSTSAEDLCFDLRALGLDDSLIARLLALLTATWASVDDNAKPSAATDAWLKAHPVEALFAQGFAPLAWRRMACLFYLLRVLGRISALDVRGACFRLTALVKAPLFNTHVITLPTGEQILDGSNMIPPEGESAVWYEINRWVFGYALDLRKRIGDDDQSLFRLALFLDDTGSYQGFLEPTLGKPRREPPPFFAPEKGLAEELPLPDYDELSAFYWRNVVVHGTAFHILYLKETADFKVAEHVRFLGLFRRGGFWRPLPGAEEFNETYESWIASVVPDWFIDFAIAAILRFKFWVTDRKTPRTDEEEMTFWSENHIVLFSSSEYITGQWWPEQTFTFTGQKGTWHRERAAARLERWLHDRLRFGFSEVNSPVYYNEHLPAVFNLVDFVEDERLRKLALMVLDLLVFDVVQRVCRGSFLSVTARVYGNGKSSGWKSSIRDFIEVLTGTLGEVSGSQEESAVSLCTSRYLDEVPECLLVIAGSTDVAMVARSRTSLSFEDAEALGIGTDSADDIMFWWSHSAYFTSETWRSSQAWSDRWHLQKSGPFKLFGYIDSMGQRILSSIIGGLETVAVWVAAYTVYMPLALLLAPRGIRSVIDLATTALDVVFAAGAWLGKGLGLLDDNDDRVRVAKPVIEQELERLAIEISAGSVVQRQHLYVWRSADAMLSSMVDQSPEKTSAQREVCIATLGPDVAVFVNKPLKAPGKGIFDIISSLAVDGGRGLLENVEFWKTFPGSLGEFYTGGSSANPELSEVLYHGVTAFASDDVFADGPGFWQGQVSNPLVWQYENVAVAIYHPTSHQRDISNENTHAFWPWDHFDEVRSEEASGGRWVYGRRDRRAEPRTPCRPRAEWRPSAEVPWPAKLRWEERPDAGEGSGYVALFSARGMRTTPADPDAPNQLSDNSRGWGHKELIADGHDNVWVTIVGDQATYGSFEAFIAAIRECRLDASADGGKCSIEIPTIRGAGSKTRSLFEVSWNFGATLNGEPHDELKLDDWPRFSFRNSAQSSNRGRPYSIKGAAGIYDTVAWGDEEWTISATVEVPDEEPGAAGSSGKLRPVQLSVYHNFHDLQNPVRTPHNLPYARPGSASDQTDLDPPITYGASVADPDSLPPAQSRLGLEFRKQRRARVASSRRPS